MIFARNPRQEAVTGIGASYLAGPFFAVERQRIRGAIFEPKDPFELLLKGLGLMQQFCRTLTMSQDCG